MDSSSVAPVRRAEDSCATACAGASERITYLIANHDLGRYLPECLHSLMGQTNPHWLAIVLDDGSSDESCDVLARYPDPRIRVLANRRNTGYTPSLRRLIAEAETDIVAILDPDDALMPEATGLLLARYASDPEVEFVHSRFAVCDGSLERCTAVHGAPVPADGTALRDGVVGAIRSFRRRAYARTAGLDDSMLYAEDRDLVYKLEEAARPVFLDAVLYRYRRRPDSHTTDPGKREIGARNTWRARRAALARRDIGGARRVWHELYFFADYAAYSRRTPSFARVIARRAARVTGSLCRVLDARARRGSSPRPASSTASPASSPHS